MTINDEVVDAFRDGQQACEGRGQITDNPYGDGGPRANVLRYWWAKGFQSRLPGDDVVNFEG